ncbi:phage tail protein [Escherichia coli]|uniref:phage tail protein n=1 Tax=Escherichia coli TaxID=562 RepID=UPI0014031A57|nr:phage tail protein [Escherichia coli]CAD5639534.1 putative tail fiber/collar phage protein [Escherichia coli]
MLRIGQVEATATQDGKYTDGSVAGGIAATRLRAAAFNAMQEELAHIVESAGLALDINDMTQVLKAIQKLTLSRANPFADIKSDGAAAISTALTNLGLGEGSALPVGVPVPWPLATPPTGWLKCNGAPFAAENYPKLALVYPGLVLPDLRGEFIRGWDDGRGVDSGRALLSAQSDTLQNITGSFFDMTTGTNNNTFGAFTSSIVQPNLTPIAIGGTYKQANYYFDASLVARTSTETRARNIAFNFIVRAA